MSKVWGASPSGGILEGVFMGNFGVSVYRFFFPASGFMIFDFLVF